MGFGGNWNFPVPLNHVACIENPVLLNIIPETFNKVYSSGSKVDPNLTPNLCQSRLCRDSVAGFLGPSD